MSAGGRVGRAGRVGRVAAAYDAIAADDRPEVWIALRDRSDVEAELAAAQGSLAGLLLAVKNNVDVAGLPTTAGCPGFASAPAGSDAPAVARLRAAGATVLGATNLDQFATGLVGQRSPYGGVRDARRPSYVSGGSSAGSAVAVALGQADLAIGTDTAGSGRVPAGYQGLVGIKPTLGVVSTVGVVPACRSWDAVTILARDLDTAERAMGVMAGGPGTRSWPDDVPLAAPPGARVAVPDRLPGMAPGWAEAFEAACARLRDRGCVVEPVPFDSFLVAARLLYGGALVAERHAAVGAFVEAHLEDPDAGLDPTVADIIARAATPTASAMTTDLARLDELRLASMAALETYDVLLVPTAPGQPTTAEVAADPVGVNAWVGTFTNFCNLFDLCAVAVPAGTADEAQFGVTVVGRTFHDGVVLDLARRVHEPATSATRPGATEPLPATGDPWPVLAGASATELLVVGAHLRGQPLEHQLTQRGARWVGPAATSAAYRLVELATTPAKPGLLRVGEGGSAITGELWQLSTGALGDFLAALPAPMCLGRVELDDGREVVGFAVEHEAADRGVDITAYGGWRAWLGRDA